MVARSSNASTALSPQERSTDAVLDLRVNAHAKARSMRQRSSLQFGQSSSELSAERG